MISGNFNDHADFEFDPASLPIIRLWSASSPLDSNTDVLEEGLGLTPFPNDYDNECNDEDDVPELSSGSSSSDLSPGTILETPLEITPDLTPESTDQSPSKVTEFDESSPYLSPNDGVWPDTPSEVFSGPSPSQNATTIRKRQTTSGAIVRRRSTSDALESQIPIEFAGLSRPAPLPPIIKKIRKRIDLTRRNQGNNTFGRRGTLSCAQCRKRNSKCVYSNRWTPCKFCVERGILETCVKLPGPKSATPYKPITPADAQIPPEDVLLLEFAYAPEPTSPRTRSFIREFAVQYGPAIQCLPLRHAVLAYAACLLRAEGFQARSDAHSSTATCLLMRKLDNPTEIKPGDVFAANLLMWTLSIQNRRQDAIIHARGIMEMVKYLWSTTNVQALSDIFRVFGPLVFGDATFFVSLGLDSFIEYMGHEPPPPVAFKDRVRYHEEIVRCGGTGIQWVDPTLLSIHVSLWDVKRRLLSYLVDVAKAHPHTYARGIVDAAVQYVMSDLDDIDFRNAVDALEWPDPSQSKSWTLRDELTNYLSLRIQTIQLFNILLQARTLLEGLYSCEALSVARQILKLGQPHRLPRDGPSACYTWGIVLDLGMSGLVFCARRFKDGYLWVFEELEYRNLHTLQILLAELWGSRTPQAVAAVIKRILHESDHKFESGGPAAKP